MDDEDRENEGDLCMAAEKVTPENINFMATYGRGLICLSMTAAKIDSLDLPPMVDINTSPYGTGFTVSIEARCGWLSRPENPDDPGGAAIDLRLAVIPALSPTARPDALTVINGGPGSGIHKSVDGGETWTELKSGLPGVDKGRIGLAVAQKHALEFDAVVGRDEAPVKPDPAGVLLLCREFDVRPEETLVVGDYLFDLLSARAAGAVPVLLDVEKALCEFAQHADFTVENLGELVHIIDRL